MLKKLERRYLISPNQLKEMTTLHAPPDVSPLSQAYSRLDEEMADILNEKALHPADKIKKYNMILEKFLTVSRQTGIERDKPIPVDVVNAPPLHPQQDSEEDRSFKINEIVKALPDRAQRNARFILEKLLSSRGSGWMNDSGELIYNDQTVHGSHIFDLIKYVITQQIGKKRSVNNKPPPSGYGTFLTFLMKSHIPSSVIGNVYVREQLFNLTRSASTPTRQEASSSPPQITPYWEEEAEFERSRSKKPRSPTTSPITRKTRGRPTTRVARTPSSPLVWESA